ncbi:MAG: hypothetical protein ACOYLB_11355 [Phototrophicaceae bacterium]
MRKIPSIADTNRVALGLLLVGLGALALYDAWFPHGLLVVGMALLARHTMQHQPLRTAYLAITLLGLGALFWTREQLLQLGLSGYVPILFVGVGGGLLAWVAPHLDEPSPPSA